MAEKLTQKEWMREFFDAAEALANQSATIEEYAGHNFAVFDDGSIYPLDNDSRIAMNDDIAYYRRNPDCRIIGDYCQSSAESIWRFEVGGIA